MTSARPPTAATMAGNASIVAGTVSSWRAPWFETKIPSTPASTAFRASLGLRIPFKMNFYGLMAVPVFFYIP